MEQGTAQTIEFFVAIGLPLLLLLVAYSIGAILEHRHYRDIRQREHALAGYPATTFEALPDAWKVTDGQLVLGSVVISLDYFKRFIAGLRALVGGRVKTYEPLLDRARREAILRMLEQAKHSGFDAVINIRLQTSRLANSRGDGNGTAGVEIVAFGTAIHFADS